MLGIEESLVNDSCFVPRIYFMPSIAVSLVYTTTTSRIFLLVLIALVPFCIRDKVHGNQATSIIRDSRESYVDNLLATKERPGKWEDHQLLVASRKEASIINE